MQQGKNQQTDELGRNVGEQTDMQEVCKGMNFIKHLHDGYELWMIGKQLKSLNTKAIKLIELQGELTEDQRQDGLNALLSIGTRLHAICPSSVVATGNVRKEP